MVEYEVPSKGIWIPEESGGSGGEKEDISVISVSHQSNLFTQLWSQDASTQDIATWVTRARDTHALQPVL